MPSVDGPDVQSDVALQHPCPIGTVIYGFDATFGDFPEKCQSYENDLPWHSEIVSSLMDLCQGLIDFCSESLFGISLFGFYTV